MTGFLLSRYKQAPLVPQGPVQALTEGQALWQRVFGSAGTDKETGSLQPRYDPSSVRPLRSMQATATNAAVFRLLQSLKSKSPGAWTDNRYEQAAHYTGITFVSIFRLARLMSQAEFQVFIKDPTHPDGKRPVTETDAPHGGFYMRGDELVPRHPEVRPYQLVTLLKKPNPQDSFGKMLMRFIVQKYLTGTRLCWMVENVLGAVAHLFPIETVIASPNPIIDAEHPDGYYRIQPLYPNGPYSVYPTVNAAAGATIDARWMLVDRFPHPFFRYDGYSPLTGMKLHVDEVEAMDRARWYEMKRSIKPNAILQMTEVEGNIAQLTTEQMERIRAEFESEFQSPENWGKLIVGAPGFDLQLQTDTREVDYYQGWEQLVSFVMGGFGITKEAAGMISDASYAALFATLKQLYFVTLDPECQDVAQDFTNNLAPMYGDDLEVEVRARPIDDHEKTLAELGLLMQAKAVTKNEVRKHLKFSTTLEPWGNDIAGDPSPAETLMNTQMLAAALPDESEEQEKGVILPGKDGPEGADRDPEPEQIKDTRPGPGSLGEGSRGPQDKNRKSFDFGEGINRLRRYYAVKALTNGKGGH